MDWIDGARAAQDLGYSIWLASDHFGRGVAPIPALALAAEATSLRVGTLVLANDFRHPAVVAKETATLDLLTDGRLELGIGTGWLDSDYQRSGIRLDPPRVRVERLMEAVDVIKGLWSGADFSYDGTHYQVKMQGQPAPVQEPHPPLLIAGSGPRMLRFAAREGQIVSITATVGHDSLASFWGAVVRSGSGIAEQLDTIRQACDGEQLPEINVLIHHLEVTDDQRGAAEKVGAEVGADAKAVLGSPHILIGTSDQVTATLVERRDRHRISYIVVRRESMHDLAPVVGLLANT
jgi:probable F420-dependent oxidoreductase